MSLTGNINNRMQFSRVFGLAVHIIRHKRSKAKGAVMIGNLRGIVYLLILIALSRTALSQPASQATAQGASIAGTGSITGAVKLGDAPAAGITMALAPERMGRMAPPQSSQPNSEIANRAVTDEKGLYRF